MKIKYKNYEFEGTMEEFIEFKKMVDNEGQKNAPDPTPDPTPDKPKTRKEAIDEWKKQKGITEEDCQNYAKAAKEVRAEMMAENEKRKALGADGKYIYAKNYLRGKKWQAEFKKRMAAKGFK